VRVSQLGASSQGWTTLATTSAPSVYCRATDTLSDAPSTSYACMPGPATTSASHRAKIARKAQFQSVALPRKVAERSQRRTTQNGVDITHQGTRCWVALRPFKRSLTPALSPGLQMEMPNWDWAGESAGLRSSLSQFAFAVRFDGRRTRTPTAPRRQNGKHMDCKQGWAKHGERICAYWRWSGKPVIMTQMLLPVVLAVDGR